MKRMSENLRRFAYVLEIIPRWALELLAIERARSIDLVNLIKTPVATLAHFEPWRYYFESGL